MQSEVQSKLQTAINSYYDAFTLRNEATLTMHRLTKNNMSFTTKRLEGSSKYFYSISKHKKIENEEYIVLFSTR